MCESENAIPLESLSPFALIAFRLRSIQNQKQQTKKSRVMIPIKTNNINTGTSI